MHINVLLSNYLNTISKRIVILSKQSLFTNAGYLVGIETINSIIGFLFWTLAARMYSPENLGFASAVLSSIAIVSMIASFGTGNGLIRFLPSSVSPNRMLNSLFLFNALAACLVGTFYLVGLPIWSASLANFRENILQVVGFVIYCLVITLNSSLRMTFLALRRAKYAFRQAVISNSFRLILVILLTGFAVWGIIGSLFFAVLITALISFLVFLPRAFPSYRPILIFSWTDLSSILPYSFGIYIASLMIQAPARLFPIIALESIGSASAAHVHITFLVGGMLVTPGMGLATSAFVESSNNPQESASIFSKAALTGLAITLLGSIILIFVSPWLLLLFGVSYSIAGTELLRWLSVTAPFVVLTGVYFAYLRFKQRIKRLVGLSLIMLIVSLAIAHSFTPSIGTSAFGIGWFVSFLVLAVIILVETYTSNSLHEFRKQTYLIISHLLR